MTVYIMHERRKGEDSFYFPYLNILPDLNNLSEWKDEELAQLQVRLRVGALMGCLTPLHRTRS